MRCLLPIALLILLLVSNASLGAGKDLYPFKIPTKKAQFATLTQQLRCLVCQNENLADSNASLAIDLRNEVYRQVKAGKTNAQIIHYMVSRYGDFVLFKPLLKKETYVLWFGPFALLFLGLLIVLLTIRKQKSKKQNHALSIEEQARIKELLK